MRRLDLRRCAEHRCQDRPHVFQHPRLRRCSGMEAVGLHQRGIKGDALQQERQQCRVVLAREASVNSAQAIAISRAVVHRQLDAEQQHLRGRAAALRDHRREVRTDFRERQPTQAVVGAQLQDHERGTVLLEQARQARQSRRSGLTADAGIDQPPGRTHIRKAFLQQGRPGCLQFDIVGGRERIPHQQDRARRDHRGRAQRQQQRKAQHNG